MKYILLGQVSSFYHRRQNLDMSSTYTVGINSQFKVAAYFFPYDILLVEFLLRFEKWKVSQVFIFTQEVHKTYRVRKSNSKSFFFSVGQLSSNGF